MNADPDIEECVRSHVVVVVYSAWECARPTVILPPEKESAAACSSRKNPSATSTLQASQEVVVSDSTATTTLQAGQEVVVSDSAATTTLQADQEVVVSDWSVVKGVDVGPI